MNSNMTAGPEMPAPPVPEVEYVASKRGRPRKTQDKGMMEEVMRLYFVERFSMRKVAEVMGVSHMSVYRMLSDPNIEILI